jgi:hypothetical protein
MHKSSTLRTPVVFLLTLLLAGQSSAFAASAPVELKWSELNTAIYGHSVELTLPGAFTVKGEVVAVREDALVLDIRKTWDARAFPTGNAVLPRASVTLLKVDQRRESHWRTMGTIIGVLGGVTLGGYIAGKTASSPGPGIAIFLGTATAAAIAGHVAGGAADRKTRMIRIVQ